MVAAFLKQGVGDQRVHPVVFIRLVVPIALIKAIGFRLLLGTDTLTDGWVSIIGPGLFEILGLYELIRSGLGFSVD